MAKSPIERLRAAFESAMSSAYNGWDEAQDGHSYDCSAEADRQLMPAQKQFDAALAEIELLVGGK